MINIRDIFRKSIVYIVASIEIWLFYNEGIGKVEKKTKLHIIVLPIIFVFFFQILFLIKRHRWATCIATCAIGFKVDSIHSDGGVVLCRYIFCWPFYISALLLKNTFQNPQLTLYVSPRLHFTNRKANVIICPTIVEPHACIPTSGENL